MAKNNMNIFHYVELTPDIFINPLSGNEPMQMRLATLLFYSVLRQTILLTYILHS
jgi:hypothetical protein